jgi:hypothetical protein
MTALTQTIRQYIVQADENYAELMRCVVDSAATANQGLEPVEDCYGRLHAPCQGYCWDDDVYPGGAYLPIPDSLYRALELTANISRTSYAKYGYTTRVQTTLDEANELKAVCDRYAEITTGRLWDDGASCYCYIKTARKSLTNLVDEYRAEQARVAHAAKGIAPQGRQTVTGIVRSVKSVPGYYGNSFKMLVVLENGATVYGSLPRSIDDVNVGQTIKFTANFEQPADDNTHASFKRPTKASVC